MKHVKTNWKRMLALLLVLTMCLTLVPGYALADDGIELAEDVALPELEATDDEGIVSLDEESDGIALVPDGDVSGDDASTVPETDVPDEDVPGGTETEDEADAPIDLDLVNDDAPAAPDALDDGEEEVELVKITGTVSDTETFAADNVSTYTLQIPSTLSVANSGWNATSGISATGTLADRKKLTVTASSANSWALKSGDNSVGYKMAKASTDTTATTSWEFTTLSGTATTKAMGIIVDDYSTKPAGTYTDTVTFTAKVENATVLSGALVDGAIMKVNFKWRGDNSGDYVQGTYNANSGTFTVSKGGSDWGRDNRAVYKVEKSGNNITIGAGIRRYDIEGMQWTFNTTNDTYTTTNGDMVNDDPGEFGLISVTLNGTDITSQLTKQ